MSLLRTSFCICLALTGACSNLKSSDQAQTPSQTSFNALDVLCIPDDPDELEAWSEYDLWQRIRDSYAMEFDDNRRIQSQLAWYQRHPDYLSRVAKRGAPYMHHIVEELEARDMPAELAFLPVVESAFDPFAYSPGRASGMWQIIPGTGKMLGLKQTWWYDGRRDVVASTDAALRYLDKLQRQFDGDWLLALAAYNAGGGTVRKAIRRNKKDGLPTDYWSLDLPRETEDYVPRLLALSMLYGDPERYQLSLPTLENEQHFAAVDVEAQIDLAQAAQMAALDMDEFYRLNPAFNRWATDPEGPHRLLVPLSAHETFQSQLQTLPPEARVSWQRHTIKSGETLSHIANKYQVSVATLQSVNRIRGHNIRAGKTLLVPQASRGDAYYSHSSDQRLARKQASGAKNGKTRIEHTVTSGDSFWSLSRKYGPSSSAIARWNNMAAKDTLKIGQKLVIWTEQADSKQLALVDRKHTVPSSEALTRKLNYRVRSGDSLSKIAAKFNVGIDDLLKWNTLSGSSYLQPGQRIVLYVDVRAHRG
ncbi:LysM peptidoglycan-binding domain-containing protein [Agaribacterium haliotis]|uniref:LysM peptidoglycan-binding domain-containing protein n=1 Tax=Agaribacterium haliotis TaxID=2013869 RepID=UPI000BB54039|nr:LysM peptidoglycan-binding domain-containing protein [Agaribacterium haliotis]